MTTHLSSLSAMSFSSSAISSFIMSMLSTLCLGRAKVMRATPPDLSSLRNLRSDIAVILSCFHEHIIQLAVGQPVHDRLHGHADGNVLFGDLLADTSEYLERPIIEKGNAVGDVLLEAGRAVFQLAEGNEFPAAGDIEPLHTAR